MPENCKECVRYGPLAISQDVQAIKMAELGAWDTLQPKVLPLLQAILQAADRPVISTLDL